LNLLEAYPDLRWVIEDIVAEKEKWSPAGLILAPTEAITWEFLRQQKVSVGGMTIHHITGGKIIDSHTNWDALG
jgi:hypothetical protein